MVCMGSSYKLISTRDLRYIELQKVGSRTAWLDLFCNRDEVWIYCIRRTNESV